MLFNSVNGKCQLIFLILMGLFNLANQAKASGAIYYVDATNGDNSNNGLSPENAWQTLSKVNTAIDGGTIQPGDSVLFKRNETFAGYLDVDIS